MNLITRTESDERLFTETVAANLDIWFFHHKLSVVTKNYVRTIKSYRYMECNNSL